MKSLDTKYNCKKFPFYACRFSAFVRDFDAYAIGFLFCLSAAPIPFRLASVCNTGISVVLKYVNVES